MSIHNNSYVLKQKSDLLIAEILNGNGYKYSELEIEDIVRDFCLNKISPFYDNFNIVFLDNDTLNKMSNLENINGFVKENTMYLKSQNLLNLKKGKIDIIRTIMHEVQHIKQNYMLENNIINYKVYLTLMEEIVSYKVGKSFYKENYNYIFTEIDARINAEFELYEYLDLYCKDILEIEKDNILENILQCEEDSKVNYRIVNGEKYDLEEIFDLIIKNNPTLVNECPILNFYYELDGSKIPLGNIIERKNLIPEDVYEENLLKSIRKLDSFIIKNRRGSKENIKKDINSIKLLNNYNKNIVYSLYSRIYDTSLYDVSRLSSLLNSRIKTIKRRINKKKIAADIKVKRYLNQ